MNKPTRITAIILTSTLLGATFVQTASDLQDAHAATTTSGFSTSLPGFPTSLPTGDTDSNQPIIISNDTGNTLTPDQVKTASRMIQEISDSAPALAADFTDPAYANTVSTNGEVRGKAGLTAKAAAKLLKIGLKKMGKKAYEKIAKSTGLELVGLNWSAINKVADIFGSFGGKVESALKKALKKVGLNDYWAGVAAKIISTVFF